MSFIGAEILAFGTQAFWVALAVFLRVGAMMAILPVFGDRSVPERIRLALTIGFTLIVAPSAASHIDAFSQSWSGLPLWLGAEVVSGLAIGIVVRIFVLVLQIAGSIAAQSTSLSQIFGGTVSDPQPAIGHVLWIGGMALAVLFGLHLKIAMLLILSYEILPVGRVLGADIMLNWATGRISEAFGLAFVLAAPFVIASLIYNVALGVINKAMPQLMVAFVGAPAITAGGLILLAIVAPALLEIWRDGFMVFLDDPFGAPR